MKWATPIPLFRYYINQVVRIGSIYQRSPLFRLLNQDFAGQDGRSDLRLGFAFHQFAVVLN